MGDLAHSLLQGCNQVGQGGSHLKRLENLLSRSLTGLCWQNEVSIPYHVGLSQSCLYDMEAGYSQIKIPERIRERENPKQKPWSLCVSGCVFVSAYYLPCSVLYKTASPAYTQREDYPII